MKIKNVLFLFLFFLLFFSFIQNSYKNNLTDSSISYEKKPKSSATISTIASKDTYVDSDDPSANFGGQDWLYVGKDFLGDLHESYFNFSFSNKPSNWIKAEISLHIWSVDQTMDVDVYLITESWNELTMNWINKPSKNVKITTLQLTTSFIRYSINVSNYISGKTNISICVSYNILVDDYVLIDSREEDLGYSWYGEDSPKLIWTYPYVSSGDDDDDDDDDDDESLLESIPGYDTLIMSGCILGIVTILIIKKSCKSSLRKLTL